MSRLQLLLLKKRPFNIWSHKLCLFRIFWCKSTLTRILTSPMRTIFKGQRRYVHELPSAYILPKHTLLNNKLRVRCYSLRDCLPFINTQITACRTHERRSHFGLLLFVSLLTCYIFVRFDGGSSRDRSGFPLESKSAFAMSLSPCRLENSGPPCSSLSCWEPGIESEGVLLRLPEEELTCLPLII